jgi:rRNA maturation endonuclease Nob1
MVNPNKGFNKVLGRKELPFKIYCTQCKKHLYDSEWEMEGKLCMVCSGQYDMILLKAGVKKNNQK